MTPGSEAAMKASHFHRSWKYCAEPPAAVFPNKQRVHADTPAQDLISAKAIKIQAIIPDKLKTGKRKEDVHEKNIMDRWVGCLFSLFDLCGRSGKSF
jgi:hypothetical protein